MRARPYLLLVAFSGGMSVLAVQLSASRLLAPYFGTTLVVWANLIGLTLLYLTAGYVLGGRLADARPAPGLLYGIFLLAGLAIVLLPLLAPPLLEVLLRLSTGLPAGLFAGSFLAALLLLALPVGLLGTVSPFVIRLLLSTVETAGSLAGWVYAISTLGSLVGTVLPVLWMLPVWGTRNTLLAFGGLLVLLGVLGLGGGRASRRPSWAAEGGGG